MNFYLTSNPITTVKQIWCKLLFLPSITIIPKEPKPQIINHIPPEQRFWKQITLFLILFICLRNFSKKL